MRRKNLIVKRKVKNPKLLIQNPKIIKSYKNFKSILFKNVKHQKYAIAVSGGADSLCLAYFSKVYSSEFRNKVHTLIVDHKLRKESSNESKKVKNILKRKKINSKILTWTGKVPESNIQFNARNIRYSLISKYCTLHNIKYIVTAHHMDDQIENFFIRLFRGSGLAGLSSMPETFQHNDKLKIIRPFLGFKKKDLKFVTIKYFKTYIKDPSNKNEKYLRVRVRKYRKKMETEGLDTNKIIKTVNNLLSANKALSFYKNKALHKYVSFLSKDKCLINTQIFSEEAGEIIFKSFSDILSLISGTYYPPRSKKTVNLINRIKKHNSGKYTLGGCIVERKESYILVTREIKQKKMTYQPYK